MGDYPTDPTQHNLHLDVTKQVESNEVTENLRDLLTYDNPNLPRYQEITRKAFAQRNLGSNNRANFSEFWLPVIVDSDLENNDEERHYPSYEGFDKLREFFKSKLEDSTLIDLGGAWNFVMMPMFAKRFGVSRYVNVDLNGAGFEKSNPFKVGAVGSSEKLAFPKREPPKPLEIFGVQSDMLDFVARLPDNSVNYTINGIDINMIRDGEYNKALLSEIIRTTKKGGIIFGIHSDIWGRRDGDLTGLKNITKDLVEKHGYLDDADIFEKFA